MTSRSLATLTGLLFGLLVLFSLSLFCLAAGAETMPSPVAGNAGAEQLPSYDGKAGVKAGQQCVNAKDGAVMVWVPAGEFLMGSKAGEGYEDERPQHKVFLDGFWIAKTPVTVVMYRTFCLASGHKMPDEPEFGWQDDHPMVSITWNDAVAYAKWAGAALPSEAQWEKAARGSDGRTYPWGFTWDTGKCSNSQGDHNPGHTSPVGNFPAGASPYGLLDMAGNVWEWCADWYDKGYYQQSPARNPTGPATGAMRVVRGGSWNYVMPGDFRTAYRGWNDPAYGYFDRGFRCVLAPAGG